MYGIDALNERSALRAEKNTRRYFCIDDYVFLILIIGIRTINDRTFAFIQFLLELKYVRTCIPIRQHTFQK